MGKRTWTPKQNKRSIVAAILDGNYTVEVAARIMRVQPETIKRWLNAFGGEYIRAMFEVQSQYESGNLGGEIEQY